MAKTWMAAAEEHGIPAAFIIRDGVLIAWIMPPDEHGPAAGQDHGRRLGPQGQGAGERLVAKAKEKKMMGVQTKVYTPPPETRITRAPSPRSRKWPPAIPITSDEFDMVKFSCLGMLGEIDAAVAVGTKLVERYKEDSANLNAIAWGVLNPDAKPRPMPGSRRGRPRRRPPRPSS